jgi:NAD(P)-dependent dehydrogenase (short-subunit alcohol dehydrogenase family)
MTRLNDKVAIVTGAARGIGRAYALALAKEGATIVAADIIDQGGLGTVSEIEKMGGKSIAIACDVSKESDTVKLAEEAVETFGKLDILVNNAAKYADLKKRPFNEIDVAEWDEVLAVNIRGTWLCIKAVFPSMKRQNHGKIVNVSSGTFFAGVPGFAHYVASKGAVIGLTRALARELGQYNITVNAIAPGQTITESKAAERGQKGQLSGMSRMRSLQREEYPSDLVGTMVFLCSSDSDFMTGQTLLVDGGGSMH